MKQRHKKTKLLFSFNKEIQSDLCCFVLSPRYAFQMRVVPTSKRSQPRKPIQCLPTVLERRDELKANMCFTRSFHF